MSDALPPGVQNERTALAWQRTALSLIVATVALARLTFDELGVVAVLVPVLALPLASWVVVESGTRYRRRANQCPARGGRAAAVLTGILALLALTELAAITADR